jgi:hypothetical protein
MTKTETIKGLNTDLERLANRTEVYLQENKFEVAYSKDPTEPASWFFIQARKAGALRTAAGARRSTDITIRGSPDNFQVSIGTGEWGKNLVTSVPLFIVPIVGISATLVKLYTAKKFEDNLWKFIKDQAKFLSDSAWKPTPSSGNKLASPSATAGLNVDSRSYECDYVEGYPGWSSQITGGKLVLKRERSGKNSLTFKAPNGKEFTIAAADITEATIVARRKGLGEDDLMVQLACKSESGRTIRPILNLHDDIIRGVVAGIDELVAEEKGLRSLEQVSVSAQGKYCSSCGIQITKEAKFCLSCGQKQT